MLSTMFLLLIAFQLKHYIADFPLHNKYLVERIAGDGWVLSLFTHSFIHGVFTLLICLSFDVGLLPALGLALLDMSMHFFIERWKMKSTEELLCTDPTYWYYIGKTQMFHHLTHYWIIFFIVYF